MYLLSIVCVVVVTAVMGFVTGISIGRLFDIISLLLLVLFLIPMLVSAGLLKDFNNAFRLVVGKQCPEGLMELKRAKEAVSLAVRVSIAASVFLSVLSGALILFTAEDLTQLGPSVAVALITLIYGLGLILVLLPLQSRLNLKIQEFINEKDS